MENLHVNQKISRLLIVNYGYINNNKNIDSKSNFLLNSKWYSLFRNMPLDEAISFISRRYATFVEKGGPDKVGVKEEETKVVTSGSLVTQEKVSFGGSKPAPASSRIPANTSLPKEVVNIIGFLMDDRAMSIMEYDRLIK